MPTNVKNYLGLSIIGLAIGLVSAVFGFDDAAAKIPSPSGGTIIIVIDIVMFAISIGLITAVVWGHQNWARWVQAVFYVLGLASLAMMAVNPAAAAQMSSFQLGVAVVNTILQGIALFFIFTGDAKAWFKKADARA